MSVSNTAVRSLSTANGVTTSFAIPFDFELGANEQVKVYVVDETTREKTLQVEGAEQDYTLTGDDIPNSQNFTTVEFNDAPASGNAVLIIRETPINQTDSYTNASSVSNVTLMRALDKTARLTQEVDEKAQRALKLRKGSASTDIKLEEPSPGHVIGWNDAGDAIEAKTAGLPELALGVGTGLVAKTGDATGVLREIEGVAGEIGVSNGDGVSGNPTLGIEDNAITEAKLADDAVTEAKLADDAVTTAKILDDAVTEAKLSDDVRTQLAASGSGQGEKSYFENPEFEDLEGVTVYDDGGAFVDGTGGTPSALSVDITTDPAKVLTGNTSQETPSSLLIQKAASDASGEGVTFTTVALDAADVGKVMFGRFEIDASDANYPSGDLTLHAYDVASGEEIAGVRVQGIADDNSIPAFKGLVHFSVPTEAATTGVIRLSLHCETDNAASDAWEIVLDALVFGPQSRVIVRPQIRAVDAGPITIDAVTTAPTKGSVVDVDRVSYSRDGEYAVIDYYYYQASATGAAAGSGAYLFRLPAGLEIDLNHPSIRPHTGSAKFNQGTVVGSGTVASSAGTSSEWHSAIHVYDATHVRALSFSSASDHRVQDWVSNSLFPLTNADVTYSFKIRVPIAEWKSSDVIGPTQRTFRLTDLNLVRVTTTPTKPGQYRSKFKTSSSRDYSAWTDTAPSIAPSKNGLHITAQNYSSAGSSGNPNAYEIFVGRNRSWLLELFGATGRIEPLSHDYNSGGTAGVGLHKSYSPETGILLINAASHFTAVTGTAGVGMNTFDGVTPSTGYFDAVIGESPADVLVSQSDRVAIAKRVVTASEASTVNTVHTRSMTKIEGGSGFATLSGGNVILQPGKYLIRMRAHAYDTSVSRLYLYNVSLGSYVSTDAPFEAASTSDASRRDVSNAVTLNILQATEIEFRQFASAASATGLAFVASTTNDPGGANTVAAQMEITKVG